MSFSRIAVDTYGDKAAELAVNRANQRIGDVTSEHSAIAAESEAIVADALTADPKEAQRLCKRHEALRVRRMAALMGELRIMGLKSEATQAIRAAARAHAVKQSELLATCEEDLRKAAMSLGYSDGDRNWTQLFVTDPNRRATLAARADSELRANNFNAVTAEDKSHEAELRRRIAEALK